MKNKKVAPLLVFLVTFFAISSCSGDNKITGAQNTQKISSTAAENTNGSIYIYDSNDQLFYAGDFEMLVGKNSIDLSHHLEHKRNSFFKV